MEIELGHHIYAYDRGSFSGYIPQQMPSGLPPRAPKKRPSQAPKLLPNGVYKDSHQKKEEISPLALGQHVKYENNNSLMKATDLAMNRLDIDSTDNVYSGLCFKRARQLSNNYKPPQCTNTEYPSASYVPKGKIRVRHSVHFENKYPDIGPPPGFPPRAPAKRYAGGQLKLSVQVSEVVNPIFDTRTVLHRMHRDNVERLLRR